MSNIFNALSSLLTIATICLQHFLFAQEPQSGPCPKVEGMKDFNFNKLPQLWYAISYTPFSDNHKLPCLRYQFYPPNGFYWPLTTSSFDAAGNFHQTNYTAYIIGSGTAINAETGCRYTFFFTDYEKIAALYYCKSIDNDMHKESFHYLSTTRNPEDDSIIKVRQSFVNNGLDPFGVRANRCPESFQDYFILNSLQGSP